MLHLHVIWSDADAQAHRMLKHLLEIDGHRVWQDPHGWARHTYSSDRANDTGILGCDVVILLWSSAAAESRSVLRELKLAQRLLKPILVAKLDSTPISGATRLPAFEMPHLEPDSLLDYLRQFQPDALTQRVVRRLADERLSIRREGIESLRQLVNIASHRELAMKLLRYLVDYEPALELRVLAQTGLDQSE